MSRNGRYVHSDSGGRRLECLVPGINSGSQPLTSGRGGFGFSVKDVTRRAYFDHLELFRQV